MTNPIETISRGLDAHEREKSGTKNSYSYIVDLPKTTADVNRLAVRARNLALRHHKIADGVKSDLEKYRVEAEARFNELGKSKDENGVTRDSLGANTRKSLLEKEIAANRKTVLARSEGDRAGILTELKSIKEKIAGVSDLHNDAVAILMTSTLGSKRRGEFTRDLAHAGPREIELTVKSALVEMDREKLASCFSRIDSLDKKNRELVNVSKADAARHLVADQLQLGLQSLALADVSLDLAMIDDDEVNGKRIASQRKIGLGAKKRDLKKLGIDLDSESEDGGNPAIVPDDEWQKNLDSKFPAVPPPHGTVIIGRESNDA